MKVAIVASEACHQCRAKQFCSMGEGQEKIIEVQTPKAAKFAVGDVVEVGEELGMAFKAVLIAYVGALVVLLLLLFGSLCLGLSEGLSVVVALIGVAAYYFVVYLNRKKIKRTINFTITES